MKALFSSFALASSLALAATGAVHAQDYPSKPVTIVVPFTPGGIVDIAARLVGDELSKKWNQPVIIENRPGGSGVVGASSVTGAAPDGYTILAAETATAVTNAWLQQAVPYDFVESFRPVVSISDTPIVLASWAGSDVTRGAEFFDLARKQEVIYASPLAGSLNHLTGEWVATEAGLKLKHIGYKGGAPAATALASGEVSFAFLAYSSALPFVDAGQIRLLAVTGAERSALAPDVPTLKELGAGDVVTQQWTGLFVPKATPDEVVAKLNADVLAVLADPQVQEKFWKSGATVIPASTDEFAARLAADRVTLKDVLTKAGLIGK